MESPRPVPPYLRLVVPSACWNDSKMMRCLSAGMPMPVSSTEKAMTPSALASAGLSGRQPLAARDDAQRHLAALGELERVREQVLEHLLQAFDVGSEILRQAGA